MTDETVESDQIDWIEAWRKATARAVALTELCDELADALRYEIDCPCNDNWVPIDFEHRLLQQHKTLLARYYERRGVL